MPRINPALTSRHRSRGGDPFGAFYLYDSVSRADAAVPGTPEKGVWTQAIGTWGVVSQQIKPITTVSFTALLTAPVGASDYTYQVKMPVAVNNAAVVFRYTDEQNWWQVFVNGTTNYLLQRRSGGATNTQQTIAIVPANNDVVKIDNRSSVITVSINGVAQSPVADGTGNASLVIGLRAGDGNPRFSALTALK